MTATNPSKPRRSHHRAKQQGLTRVGVHESVLKTAQRAVDQVRKITGKQLRLGELFDWLAGAEESLVIIGTHIAVHRPYEVLIDAQAAQATSFVRVVNGWKQTSNLKPLAVPEAPPSVKKSQKQKKKYIAGSESFPGFD